MSPTGRDSAQRATAWEGSVAARIACVTLRTSSMLSIVGQVVSMSGADLTKPADGFVECGFLFAEGEPEVVGAVALGGAEDAGRDRCDADVTRELERELDVVADAEAFADAGVLGEDEVGALREDDVEADLGEGRPDSP